MMTPNSVSTLIALVTWILLQHNMALGLCSSSSSSTSSSGSSSSYRHSSRSSSLPPSNAFVTASGKPVYRYALGGAARSTQPQSLISSYSSAVQKVAPDVAPFLFYYNPHRYPAFMSGIKEICNSNNSNKNDNLSSSSSSSLWKRQDLFIASGGTDRSASAMQQRLKDALSYCGGEYLDMFVLEYVCPDEFDSNSLDSSLSNAIKQARSWVDQGLVRYVAVSTHSHVVGASLASDAGIDALMLRYSMSHKDAAEKLSLPAALQNNKPVLAFTTTRWNALQRGHPDWRCNNVTEEEDYHPPTTGDCLSFALSSYRPSRSPIEIILHSARDEDELEEAFNSIHMDMTEEEIEKWKSYGDLDWNSDGFDEYPEERFLPSD